MKSNSTGSDDNGPPPNGHDVRGGDRWGAPEDTPGEWDGLDEFTERKRVRRPQRPADLPEEERPKPVRPTAFDADEEDELPVFEALRPERTFDHGEEPPASVADGVLGRAEAVPGPAAEERGGKDARGTDFASMSAYLGDDQVARYEPNTTADYVIAALTPVCIFVMTMAVVDYLLDVRYIYTAVHSGPLRVAAWGFVLGIVAVNRLVAREGKDESVLYLFVFAGAAMLFTMSMAAFDVGSVAGGFIRGPAETVFNVALVAFLWWAVNRLTHECCIDSDPEAGDVGILTGTARRWFGKTRPETAGPADSGPYIFGMLDGMSPADEVPEETPADDTPKPEEGQVIRRRHAGMSVLLFSAPALVGFALGHRVLLNGGPAWVRRGDIHLGVYTVAALLLLMLTSLGQLREYFRARQVKLPTNLAVFWVVTGTFLVLAVVLGALALPYPPQPRPVYIEQHEYDPWTHDRGFTLQRSAFTPEEIDAQNRAVRLVGRVVLGVLALFAAYSALRLTAAAAASVARSRHRYPPWFVRWCARLDRLLEAVGNLPKRRTRPPKVRVSRGTSRSMQFVNPLSDARRAPEMSVQDQVNYAYEALCALAEDLGVAKRPGQTPYEFLREFPEKLDYLRDEARELTELVVQVNYAERRLDEKTLDRLRRFWSSYNRLRARVVR